MAYIIPPILFYLVLAQDARINIVMPSNLFLIFNGMFSFVSPPPLS